MNKWHKRYLLEVLGGPSISYSSFKPTPIYHRNGLAFSFKKKTCYAITCFFFIGPRSDHSLPISLTNWLIDELVETFCHGLVENWMNWPLLTGILNPTLMSILINIQSIQNMQNIAHLSLPWSIGWVALSFLFCRPSRYGDIWPNLHFYFP